MNIVLKLLIGQEDDGPPYTGLHTFGVQGRVLGLLIVAKSSNKIGIQAPCICNKDLEVPLTHTNWTRKGVRHERKEI